MNNNKTEIKVGLTVILGILLFVVVIMWAKSFTFSSDNRIIKVRFPNVSGLYVKDKVTVNGVEKGFVKDLKIDGNSVIAEISLSSDVDLRNDADFGIVMLDLMGGKKVEIKPGVSENKLDISKIQKGKFKGDISEAMIMFNELQSDLYSIITQTKKITSDLSKLFSENNFNVKLSETLDNINLTLNKTNKLLTQNSENINRIISNTSELTDSVKIFFETNKNEFHKTLFSSQKAIIKADSLIGEINIFLRTINKSENNLGKILNDKNYLLKANSTLDEMNKLIKTLNKQLNGEGINVKTNIF